MRGKVDCHGMTDIGLERSNNQDQFLIADLTKSMRIHLSSLSIDDHETLFGASHGKLFVVADGMGGHAAGEHASRLAVETVTTYVLNTMPWFYKLRSDSDDDLREELEDSLKRCQERLQIDATTRPERHGMGTTLTMAYVLWPRMYLVHVGDSRCYLYRKSHLKQLTTDHTIAQQMLHGGLAPEEIGEVWHHTLWNVVGGEKDHVSPDVARGSLKLGDTLLLCTDGLTKHVDDEQISRLLNDELPARETCDRLVEAARQGGGSDNITAVAVRFLGEDSEQAAAVRAAESEPEWSPRFDPLAETVLLDDDSREESAVMVN